jgi:uncharacterized protein
MNTIDNFQPGRFCWLDLAAADTELASRFFSDVFGWAARPRQLAGGTVEMLSLGDAALGSMYQLARRHLTAGVPSHWTPYVAVPDLGHTVERARAAGATLIAEPLDLAPGVRIAVILDPIGAPLGMWQIPTGSDKRRY